MNMSRKATDAHGRYPPFRTASEQGPCLTEYSKLPIRLENFVMPFHVLKIKTNSKLRKIVSGHGSQMAVSVLSAAWRDSYFNTQDAKNWTNCLIWFPSPSAWQWKTIWPKPAVCWRGRSVQKESNRNFPETAGLQAEHSHGVSSGHMISLQEISFIISALGFKIPDPTQGLSEFPQNSKIIHVLKQNLLPGITKLLSNSHRRQLIWFMWRLLSWITGPVSKRQATKATGKGGSSSAMFPLVMSVI